MNILAGPWVGEFGWELFCWQSHLRELAAGDDVDKMVVCGRLGHDAIYKDFAQYYTIPSIMGRPDCQYILDGKRRVGYTPPMLEFRGYQLLLPHKLDVVWDPVPRMNAPEKHILFEGEPGKTYKIVVHQRASQWNAERNWPEDAWRGLMSNLSGRCFDVACIGTEEAAWAIGGEDCRSLSLGEQMGILRRAELVIGPSSGPMVLAFLCGCPVVAWSPNPKDVIRYGKTWNPFRVPHRLIPAWQPSVELVIEKAEELWAAV
jgi:hypothetical protein